MCGNLPHLIVRRYQHARGWFVADQACFGRGVCYASEMPDVCEGHYYAFFPYVQGKEPFGCLRDSLENVPET